MNEAHIHLLWNHFPILGSLFAAGVLLAGIIFNDRKINQVGLVSLVIFTLLTLPAFLTGEGAEEVVEEFPGISHAAIHEHEEAAEWGLWVMIFSGVVALAGLWLQRRRENLHRTVSIIACALALFTFAVFFRVGLTGGEIRHPEIVKPLAGPEQPVEWEENEMEEE